MNIKNSSGFKTEVKRINGYLKEVVTFVDSSGEPITHIINPFMVELTLRDVFQIFAGSLLIGAPLCFTEEIWNLSISLNPSNVVALGLMSFVLMASFVYFNFYRDKISGQFANFIKRIIVTYIIVAGSIALLLALVDKFPIQTEPLIALKRVVIISFPSLFAGVITDNLK